MKHKKLTAAERQLLATWKSEELSNSECARRLGRSVSTIGREFKRNKVRVALSKNDWSAIYEPLHAQAVTDKRKLKAYLAKQPLKNKQIYAYVFNHLRKGW